MSEEELKAIERLDRMLIIESTTKNIGTRVYISDLRTVLNLVKKQQEELEKKDKIIDEMAKYIDFEEMDFNCSCLCVKEGCQEQCIKQYFENKVEGSK